MIRCVYVPGTWDLFHYGHVRLLEKAATFGQEVCVGVNSDNWVHATKGKPPIMREHERLEVVLACKHVAEAVIVDSPFGCIQVTGKGLNVLDYCKASVVVIGSDWLMKFGEALPGASSLVGKYDVVFLPYTEEVSSSNIRQRLVQYVGEVVRCAD